MTMTVKELIKELEKVEDKEKPMAIYSFCDETCGKGNSGVRRRKK